MTNQTIKLLKHCDSGAKMGINGINEAAHYVTDPRLLAILSEYKDRHRSLSEETSTYLRSLGERPTRINPVVKAMAKTVTRIRIKIRPDNARIASITARSCDVAIKRVGEYLLKYDNAEKYAKEKARSLVRIEQEFRAELHSCIRA